MSLSTRRQRDARPALTVPVGSARRRARSVLLVALLVATACPGPSDEAEPQPTASGPRPRAGGTLRVALASDVDSLDPHLATRPSSWWFARALHRGLYAFPSAPFPEGARAVPDLAEGFPEVSADGRSVRVAVRPGVAFGGPASREVTARDAAASIRRLIGTEVGIAPFFGPVESVDALDEHVVLLRLRRPMPELVSLLAHPQAAILPAETPAPVATVSRIAPSGPYRLRSFRPERTIELERNPSWSRTLDPVRGGWVDEIIATVTDPAAARRDVLDGDLALLVDPGPPDVPLPEPPEDARTATSANGCVRYLFVNPSVAPFGSVHARRAVAHALDREAFVRDRPSAQAPRLLPPTVIGHATAPVLAEDLDLASASLARAQLPDGLDATLVVGDGERDAIDAASVRRALARAGIRVRIRTVPAATLYPNHYLRPGARTAMGIATWCADWPGLAGRGVLAPLADPGSVGLRAGPARPQIGAGSVRSALAGAAVATEDEAAARWAAADEAVVRAAVTIPLSWPAERVVIAADLQGWEASPMFPRGDPTAIWL